MTLRDKKGRNLDRNREASDKEEGDGWWKAWEDTHAPSLQAQKQSKSDLKKKNSTGFDNKPEATSGLSENHPWGLGGWEPVCCGGGEGDREENLGIQGRSRKQGMQRKR